MLEGVALEGAALEQDYLSPSPPTVLLWTLASH